MTQYGIVPKTTELFPCWMAADTDIQFFFSGSLAACAQCSKMFHSWPTEDISSQMWVRCSVLNGEVWVNLVFISVSFPTAEMLIVFTPFGVMTSHKSRCSFIIFIFIIELIIRKVQKRNLPCANYISRFSHTVEGSSQQDQPDCSPCSQSTCIRIS